MRKKLLQDRTVHKCKYLLKEMSVRYTGPLHDTNALSFLKFINPSGEVTGSKGKKMLTHSRNCRYFTNIKVVWLFIFLYLFSLFGIEVQIKQNTENV